MKNLTLAVLMIVGSTIVFGGAYFLQKLNVERQRNNLEVAYNVKVDELAVYHNKMRASILQTAQVDRTNDEQYNAYVQAWEKSVSKSSTLDDAVKGTFPMLFAQATISQQDLAIKMKLVDLININRNEFADQNKYLLMACEEYNKFVGNPFNKLFLPAHNQVPIECKTVVSSATQNAIETGIDDEIFIYQ